MTVQEIQEIGFEKAVFGAVSYTHLDVYKRQALYELKKLV